MNENKKGMNILYPVLGVATLVVAIIGATFAYFSASQTNTNITGNVAEAGGLVLDVKSVTYDSEWNKTGNNLIPLDLIAGNKKDTDDQPIDAGDQFTAAIENKCRDLDGHNVCEVYKITVTNQNKTAAIEVLGTLALESNASNMYWKLIDASTTTVSETVEGSDGDETITYEILETATENANYKPVLKGNTSENALTVDPATGLKENLILPGSDNGLNSKTYYVLIWLEEMGDVQDSADASGNYGESGAYVQRYYRGTVTFNAVDADGNTISGVTARFE